MILVPICAINFELSPTLKKVFKSIPTHAIIYKEVPANNKNYNFVNFT